ncbi:MAG TPA: hypothetical protein VFR04_09390 [Solirubrobacterales bacterium]|nr:hypothetical protein [Solirubrobacterales bacterium]
MAERRQSQIKKGGYQGSEDPGFPTKLMKPQVRPVKHRRPPEQAPRAGSQ